MNRFVNSLIYVLLATLANIIMMIVFFLILSFVAGIFVTSETADEVRVLVFVAIVTVSLIGSYLSYRRGLEWLEQKYEISRFLKRREE